MAMVEGNLWEGITWKINMMYVGLLASNRADDNLDGDNVNHSFSPLSGKLPGWALPK